MVTQKPEPEKNDCPICGKSYGINTRKDGTVRCKLCGYEGDAKLP